MIQLIQIKATLRSFAHIQILECHIALLVSLNTDSRSSFYPRTGKGSGGVGGAVDIQAAVSVPIPFVRSIDLAQRTLRISAIWAACFTVKEHPYVRNIGGSKRVLPHICLTCICPSGRENVGPIDDGLRSRSIGAKDDRVSRDRKSVVLRFSLARRW